MEKEFIKKIIDIQNCLKAPKNQYNDFGKYNYRSCEDILESVKPLLKKNGIMLTITDEIISIGDRYYIKATAIITDGENSISNSSFAREEDSKKGQDAAQITGSASSYARKYALNGLFCIDDNRDPDMTQPDGDKPQGEKKKNKKDAPQPKPTIPAGDDLNTKIKETIRAIEAVSTTEELNNIWKGLDNELKAVELIKNSIIKIRREKGI